MLCDYIFCVYLVQIDYPEAQSYRGRPRIQGGMPSMERGVNLVLDDAVIKLKFETYAILFSCLRRIYHDLVFPLISVWERAARTLSKV